MNNIQSAYKSALANQGSGGGGSKTTTNKYIEYSGKKYTYDEWWDSQRALGKSDEEILKQAADLEF